MSPFVFCSIFLPFWSFIQLGLVAGHPEKRSHWKHRGEDPRSAGKGLEAAQKGWPVSDAVSGTWAEEMRGIPVQVPLVGSPHPVQGMTRSSVWGPGRAPVLQASLPVSDPGARMLLAHLPCFHLQPRLEVLPLPLAGEGALSQYLLLCFGPVKSLVNLSPVFVKTRLLTHFPRNKISTFIWGLVSFGFAIPVFFSSSLRLCSLKSFQVGRLPNTSLNQLILLFALLVSLHGSSPISPPLYCLPGRSWGSYFIWKRMLDALFRNWGDLRLL